MRRLWIAMPVGLACACQPLGSSNLPAEPTLGTGDRDTEVVGDVDVDPRAIDWFADVGDDPTESVTVSNRGDAELTVIDVQVDGDAVFEADVRAGLPVALLPGEDVTIDVSLRTDDAGDFDAELVIDTSLGSESVALEAVIGG